MFYIGQPDSRGGVGARATLSNSGSNTVGRFPEPGDDELLAGPSRNFQVFDPLDFRAKSRSTFPIPETTWCPANVVFEQDARPAGTTPTGSGCRNGDGSLVVTECRNLRLIANSSPVTVRP